MGEVSEAESTGLAPLTDIDGNSPTAEGIYLAHVQVMDAFEAGQTEALLAALSQALGEEIPEATAKPNQSNHFRGGPYLLGGMHRRAWRVDWDTLPLEMRSSLDATDLVRVKSIPAELVMQWADHLPFVVVVLRAPLGPQSQWLAYAAESLLKALPGRLGPNNRMPRSENQLLLAAKISDERMTRIRKAMEYGSHDDSLRHAIAEGLQLIGHAAGNLHLESPFSNLLLVEGQGSMLLGDDDGPNSPFRAFVFSNGNLGPHSRYDWHIPMWIPSGIGTSSWPDFNFHPFLYAAIRNAEHVGVEAGVLDEALSLVNKRLPGAVSMNPANVAPNDLHHNLIRLHAHLQALETSLHLGATRSTVVPEGPGRWPGRLRRELQDDEGWPLFNSAPAGSESLKTAKLQAERDAAQVLESLAVRIGRALDLVTMVENDRLNRSMRFWTIVAAGLALLAILIAVIRS